MCSVSLHPITTLCKEKMNDFLWQEQAAKGGGCPLLTLPRSPQTQSSCCWSRRKAEVPILLQKNLLNGSVNSLMVEMCHEANILEAREFLFVLKSPHLYKEANVIFLENTFKGVKKCQHESSWKPRHHEIYKVYFISSIQEMLVF